MLQREAALYAPQRDPPSDLKGTTKNQIVCILPATSFLLFYLNM